MNERIRELAKQATTYHYGGLGTVIESFDREKFAELIVRECLNQLQELVPPQVTNEKLQELVNSAHQYALDVSGAKIKEHFGVEE